MEPIKPPTSNCVHADEGEVFVVSSEQSGLRLDQFSQLVVEHVSRARIQAWIEAGHIRVNSHLGRAGMRLKAGAQVSIAPPVTEDLLTILPEPMALEIVFEDADVLVVDKPAGLVVHPAPGHPSGTLVNGLLHHCQGQLSGIGGVARPGIVHRLDKDTSGLMVVAKSERAHLSLTAQLAAKQAFRLYWAVVGGHLPSPRGRVDAPIARHPQHRQKMAVVAGGRASATQWEVLRSFRGYDWVACTLETGRTHQIRVHMAHLGHPLVGDSVYGGERQLPVKLAGQALHARRLHFTHPGTGEDVQFEAEPPAHFSKLIAWLEQNR
ncbi:MAG: RluA family pseudouridine synthase [Candidatus Sericytochromatia bacterium]|nr:RluA family pseudouridine synthase [Candidatus Sericytochromatia bacterium]